MASLFPLAVQIDEPRSDLVRLGSAYGGWWVPSSLLTSDSICYLGGVGTDVTFDVALIERFGCRVWGIDPTPESLAWVSEQSLDARFTMVAVGLAGSAGELRFYAPSDPSHVSHSAKNLQGTSEFFVAPTVTVADLMHQLGHASVDLLKLDIEGLAHEVLASTLSAGLRPKILCVEFDQPEPLRRTLSTITMLRRCGYSVVKVEGFNVTLVLDEPSERTDPG
jgi:FkbM family methyltransferase